MVRSFEALSGAYNTPRLTHGQLHSPSRESNKHQKPYILHRKMNRTEEDTDSKQQRTRLKALREISSAR